MFDLSLTPAQETLVSKVCAAETELRALASTAEGDREPSKVLIDRIRTGQFPYPSSEGPFPANAMTLVLLAIQLGHADPGVALAIVSSWQAQVLLDAAGSEEQLERFRLRDDAATLQELATVLLYEGFGRSPSELTTSARRSGNVWELNGRKDLVAHPAEAEAQVVLARDTDTGRLEAFLVNRGGSGYELERDDATEGKLGLRSVHTGAVVLTGYPVSESLRLSGADGDEVALHRATAASRLLIAGIALGVAKASVEYAVGWALERKAFGRPIGSYQGVSFLLADLATAIDTAELLVWETVSGLAKSSDVAEMERQTSRALARSCSISTDAGRHGVNLLGVHGIITDHPVERWYRASAALSTIDFDPLTTALEVQ
jgi:alkylation response protein AidB-like acyl-CoA dehydrogenase